MGAAVICGAGGTFCSGAERGHLEDVGRDPAEEGRYAALGGIYRAFTRVGQFEVPSIAAVRGAAVEAGINLMLATDLRIVAEDARLISGFLRIGLHPGSGHFGLLGGRAPPRRPSSVSLRTELGPPRLPWAAALEVERGAQLRSLRGRAGQ